MRSLTPSVLFRSSNAHRLIVSFDSGESEPLIPAHTNFILTTDASLIPSSSTNSYDLNKLAEELYFERPEVMEAIRTQQRVQVPEFKELTEGDRVTGRLRTRNEAVRSRTNGDL